MGGPNGWSDIGPWLSWLYSDFPTNIDIAILAFVAGGLYMFALAKFTQSLEE